MAAKKKVCESCEEVYYGREDSKTCGNTCKMRRYRKLKKEGSKV